MDYKEFKLLGEDEQKKIVEEELQRQEKKKKVDKYLQILGWEGITKEEYEWVENLYKVKKYGKRLTLMQIREFMLLEKTQHNTN